MMCAAEAAFAAAVAARLLQAPAHHPTLCLPLLLAPPLALLARALPHVQPTLSAEPTREALGMALVATWLAFSVPQWAGAAGATGDKSAPRGAPGAALAPLTWLPWVAIAGVAAWQARLIPGCG